MRRVKGYRYGGMDEGWAGCQLGGGLGAADWVWNALPRLVCPLRGCRIMRRMGKPSVFVALCVFFFALGAVAVVVCGGRRVCLFRICSSYDAWGNLVLLQLCIITTLAYQMSIEMYCIVQHYM